ncbi:flavodoxin family protein [Acrocarpospora catenulata]|uniref:flavodoxin family protein n=1 Tax=Acrocarpospora catenulata TaxID=2836182 RepID=UPI001BD91417|nr:flavodoxin domain-containing protein [Acrocarpospora catenulata]
MRALVVYESMFGNTKKIAEEVAYGLMARIPTEVLEVGSAPAELPENVTLLVVGGPTHVMGMSRATTRKSAEDQAEDGILSRGEGIREWLATLRAGAPAESPVAAAAFDTRIRGPFSGSAAKGAHKALRRHHLRLVSPPMDFHVTGTKGPLVAGEAERAREWGRSLAETLATA